MPTSMPNRTIRKPDEGVGGNACGGVAVEQNFRRLTATDLDHFVSTELVLCVNNAALLLSYF